MFSNMRFIVMFVTAVCVLFLIKLRRPKKRIVTILTITCKSSFSGEIFAVVGKCNYD